MNNKLNFTITSLGLMLMLLSTGCFAPINSTFESAKLLEKGTIEVQGSASAYYEFEEENVLNINNNFGFAVGYGVSDQFNMKLRYERINSDYSFMFQNNQIDIKELANYFELSNKISLKKDKIALSIPIGIYQLSEESGLGNNIFGILDPRLFLTFSKSKTFEFNVIPKVHISLGDEITFMPGINVGLGLSSDLSKWAIRPEIGFDGYLTVGVGANYYFKPKKKKSKK
jgi:hypothetical protein